MVRRAIAPSSILQPAGSRCDFFMSRARRCRILPGVLMGLSQAPVLTHDEMFKSNAPDVRRLLGVEGQFGQSLGLTNDWAYRIIKAVGNYGESFERNVGQGSPLKIARGLNALVDQRRSAIWASRALSRRAAWQPSTVELRALPPP
jgi:hypothetical protein